MNWWNVPFLLVLSARVEIVLFHNYFSLAVQPNNVHYLFSRTAGCITINISQILLQYKVRGYYNKFDSMKSLWAYFWYVKMPWSGCVEHRLKHITFYIQKYIAHLVACSGPPLARDGSLGAPAFVKLAYCVEGWVGSTAHTLAMQSPCNATMVPFAWAALSHDCLIWYGLIDQK